MATEKERTRNYLKEPGIFEPATGKKIKLEVNDNQAAGDDVTITFPAASGTLLTGANDGTMTMPTSGGTTTTFSLPEVEDNLFRIVDDGDATKKIAFEASGITTGTTRTITMPDADVNLGTLLTEATASGTISWDGAGGCFGGAGAPPTSAYTLSKSGNRVFLKITSFVAAPTTAGSGMFSSNAIPAAYRPAANTTVGLIITTDSTRVPVSDIGPLRVGSNGLLDITADVNGAPFTFPGNATFGSTGDYEFSWLV